jgi:hypothetical protein
MRPLFAKGIDSRAKATCIVEAFPDAWVGSVLDVGCRTQELARASEAFNVRYTGLDIQPPADLVADLSQGIPIADGEATVVVALDVLEHVDDIYAAFAELCRVASDTVIISLPNCYEVGMRITHARGRPMSAKYGLPAEPPGDRHRWFFSMNDARNFCSVRAARGGWRVSDEGFILGPRRAKLGPLATRSPGLFSPTYVTRLAPR